MATKPTKSKDTRLADTVERLSRKLAQVTEEHQRIEAACTLAGHRAQIARWSLTPPQGFDEMPAADRFQWLQGHAPTIASQPSREGAEAYSQIMRELVGPLQAEASAAAKVVSQARAELATAKNEYELQHFDEVSEELRQQLKTAKAAAKDANDTLARLNREQTGLQLEIVEASAAVTELDQQQAASIAAGTHFDDDQFTLAQAKLTTLERRQRNTAKAQQMAQQAAHEASQHLQDLTKEQRRLTEVKAMDTARKALAQLAHELKANGTPPSALEAVCRAVSSSSLAAVTGI